MACRTTVVEVQVYVSGEQGEPLDTGEADSPIPTAELQALLAVDAESGLAWLYPNDDGALGPPVDWPVPAVQGLLLSLADMDGDGLDDLWGRNATEKTMTIWLQAPGGGFESTPHWEEFTNIAEIRDVLVGDFDGDGLADMASWVEESSLLHVFPGTGDAVDLGTVVDSTLSGVVEGRWLVGDIDADGSDDLVRIAPDGIAVWRSQGGTFDRNASVDTELDHAVDLLIELDGQYGSDLARTTDESLEIHLRTATGWSEISESQTAPSAEILLAGVLEG
jgi:hypothetical protein